MKTLNNTPLILMLKKLFPQSLAAQFIWLLLFVLFFSQVITGFVLINERKEALTVLNKRGNLNRIISTVRILEESPQEMHKKILKAVSSENIHYWFKQPRANQIQKDSKIDPQLINRLNLLGIKKLLVLESTDTDISRNSQSHSKKFNGMRNQDRFSNHTQFEWRQIAIQLKDKRWLNIASRFHVNPPLWPLSNIISLSITAILLTLVVIIMIRRITKPLKQLTQAAQKLGCGEPVASLDEVGPEDIKTASIAFNQMNNRLQRYITDRTNMLAAVSHDLRTPITTLRLRTELMDEGPTQNAFLNTLNEMQAITDSTLSFIREDNSTEPSQLIDLNALLYTICEDLAIHKKQATLISEEPCFYLCRPVAIKRALNNLIENAIRYGDKAQIEIIEHSSQLIINVKDEGPGIEEDQLEEVFKPFVRLEKSRNKDKGGMGLGLAITRSIARNHGGDIKLINAIEGGLLAELSLPINEKVK
jgi:signal transduction histidine kinase